MRTKAVVKNIYKNVLKSRNGQCQAHYQQTKFQKSDPPFKLNGKDVLQLFDFAFPMYERNCDLEYSLIFY